MEHHDIQIAVIVKQPLPGRVKTRLCPPCTPRQAAAIATALMEDVMAAVRSTPARRRVLLLEGDPDSIDTHGFEIMNQRGSGLADRLANGFDDLRDSCPAPAVIMSADTPAVGPPCFEGVASTLAEPGVATLGPCTDGGYWAIGLSAEPRLELGHRAVFENVEMSTPTTFRQQLRQLEACRFAVRHMATLRDVDTFQDALEVSADLPRSRFARAVNQACATLA